MRVFSKHPSIRIANKYWIKRIICISLHLLCFMLLGTLNNYIVDLHSEKKLYTKLRSCAAHAFNIFYWSPSHECYCSNNYPSNWCVFVRGIKNLHVFVSVVCNMYINLNVLALFNRTCLLASEQEATAHAGVLITFIQS